jgi:DNA polymerase-3 subunit beta
MKLVATKSNLVTLLSKCAVVAKPKGPMPVLSCVLLETSASGLVGVATDLAQSVSTSVPADVAKPGGVAVGARDLLDRVKSFPEGPITIERDGGKFKMSAGKRKHTLHCLPPEAFPAVSKSLASGLTMPGATLLALVRRTKPACAISADRPAIHAVLLEFSAGKISATATDSYRLSWVEEAVAGAEAGPARVLPLEAAEALLGLFDDNTEVTIGMVGQELGVRVGESLLFSTKLVDAEYPPVRQHFKLPPANGLTVSRQALTESLLSVEKATDGLTRGNVLLTATAGALHLKADGKGGAEDEIDAAFAGPEVSVGLNSRYLLDALAAVATPDVLINLGGDGMDPVWLRPTDGGAVMQIVMPTRPSDVTK